MMGKIEPISHFQEVKLPTCVNYEPMRNVQLEAYLLQTAIEIVAGFIP